MSDSRCDALGPKESALPPGSTEGGLTIVWVDDRAGEWPVIGHLIGRALPGARIIVAGSLLAGREEIERCVGTCAAIVDLFTQDGGLKTAHLELPGVAAIVGVDKLAEKCIFLSPGGGSMRSLRVDGSLVPVIGRGTFGSAERDEFNVRLAQLAGEVQ